MTEDGILPSEIIGSIATAVALEDYPDRPQGRSVLALQLIPDGSPVHVVWALAIGSNRPAMLVTAYRPSADRWDADFRRRGSS